MGPGQTINQAKGQDQWKFCCIEKQPNTLTITKRPHKIFEFLSKVATLVWITEDVIKNSIKEMVAEQQCEEKYFFIPTIDEAENIISKSEIAAIICHQSILKDVITRLKNTTAQITGIFSFGPDYSYHQIDDPPYIYHLDTQQEVLQKVKQKRFHLNQRKQVSNFISIERQIWDSNNLVRTMFCMINQQTDRKQLILEFGKLAELACRYEDKDEIEQFVDYQLKSNGDKKKTIEWYTKQSFVYGLVNGVLRLCKQPTCIFILQPYFQDFWLTIKRIYEQQQQKQVEKRQKDFLNLKKFRCYRGGKITEQELKFLKEHQDKIIQNLGFLSTSANKQIAQGFLGNVFYQIEVDTQPRNDQLDFGYAYLAEFADIETKKEQEVLFNPLNTFKVLEVSYYDQSKNIYKVTLKYGELARIAAACKTKLKQEQLKYKYLSQHQIQQKNECKLIGNVLIQQEINLEGSLEYNSKYIQVAEQSQNNEFIVDGYIQKGLLKYNSGRNYQQIIQCYDKSLKLTKNCKQLQAKYLQMLQIASRSIYLLGKFEKAIQYLQECKQIQKQTIGQNNPKYAKTLSYIGYYLSKLGSYTQAIEYMQKSQQIMIQTDNENHPDYCEVLSSLADCFQLLGQFQKQLQCLQKCQHIIKHTLGEEHNQYFSVLYALGDCFQRMGHYQKALDYLIKSEEIAKRNVGQKHQLYAAILHSLGDCYEKVGHYQKAANCAQKSMKILKQIIGQAHPQYAVVILLLGKCYQKQGQYRKAIQYYQKSKQINIQTLGYNHRQTSVLLHVLGRCHQSLEQYDLALQYLKSAQEIFKQTIGDDTYEYGLVLHTLAKCYQGMGQYPKAIQILNKSMKVLQETIGEKHNRYALVLESLASCYNKLGQSQKAVEYVKICEQIQKQNIGQGHPEYALTLFTLAKCYQSMGQYQKATEFMERCKKIQQQTIASDHPHYKITLNALQALYSKIGKTHQYPQSDKSEKVRQEQISSQKISSQKFEENLTKQTDKY